MITAAIILFLLGAAGGLAMTIMSFRGKTIPWLLAIGHGVLGAAGLFLLLVAVIRGTGGQVATIAFVILLAAALGGFYLVSFHIRKQTHPRGVIVVHALVAVAGVLTLLGSVIA
ncbi:MAG: hypothetical protein WD750_01515 [Gammaproteobacteria bacterium]